ncbi:MAG: hypothetical protein U1C49_01085, partial [Candidatus Andersenbacteria bacterium]|nr:hypothetical protein [Candidatus Andersenbacteria bacterium]
MRIVIEARALSSPGGGVKTYVRQLILGLAADKQNSLTVIYDRENPRDKFIGAGEAIIKRYT